MEGIYLNRATLAIALAIGLSACADTSYRRVDYQERSYANEQPDYCENCGVVERIEQYRADRRTSGGGAVLGAIVGGALGNQVGKGDGRKAATVAGAVVGGFAGNEIEKDRNGDIFELTIRMDSGERVTVSQDRLNGIDEGSRVIVGSQSARLL